ncbi:MAG: Holliday junction branch migration protein RuvA [Actinomycetota bacterium]|nr:Holliday junction branch migration protein RuvA [Actinomycetota bacterium]
MIGYLKGTLAGFTSDGCLLDVAGVGYKLACSATTLRALPPEGKPCKLFTHMHVREDALGLFGFSTEQEQMVFEALTTVNGVGPKVALAVCSALAPDAFRRALVTGDVDVISSVPGVGKKTAQRIVLDLKEKLALPDLEVAGGNGSAFAQARSALENLGYSPAEVRAALAEIDDDTPKVEEVVKSALRILA